MSTTLRRTGLAGLAVTGAMVATMATAAMATAATPEPATAATAAAPCGQSWDADFNTNGVNIRRGPGFGYGIVGAGYVGDKIDICGSTSGDFVDCGNGRRTDWWDLIINRRTGVQGYVSECFVNYQS